MKTLEAGLENPKVEVDLEVGRNDVRNGNKKHEDLERSPCIPELP